MARVVGQQLLWGCPPVGRTCAARSRAAREPGLRLLPVHAAGVQTFSPLRGAPRTAPTCGAALLAGVLFLSEPW